MNEKRNISKRQLKVIYWSIISVVTACAFLFCLLSYGGWITKEEYKKLEEEVVSIKQMDFITGIGINKESLRFPNGEYFQISGERYVKGVKIVVSMDTNGKIKCDIINTFKNPIFQIISAIGIASFALMISKTLLDDMDIFDFRE